MGCKTTTITVRLSEEENRILDYLAGHSKSEKIRALIQMYGKQLATEQKLDRLARGQERLAELIKQRNEGDERAPA